MPCATLADMATFTLKLDKGTLRKLTEAARKSGVTPERMAAMTLEAWILADDGPDRSLTGVGEPAHAWTGMTKDGDPDQHTTHEDHEGPFVDLDVALDALSAAKVTVRAKVMGIAPEELAVIELDSRFFDYDDFEWLEGGDPREDNAANYDLNEVGRPWSEVRPEMEAYLERKLAERK